MAKQVLSRGASDNDPSAESIRSGAAKINANFDELYGYRPHNVLDYGAVGDSHHSSGGGTDDTTAFQNAIDAAVVDGVGTGQVVVPGNRTYKITSTLIIPYGIEIVGIGGRNGAGNAAPPTLVWDGTTSGDGSCMVSVQAALQNLPCVMLRNLTLTGRLDLTNLPITCLRYRGLSGNLGSLDSGSELDRIFFQLCTGDALRIESACTNFHMHDCRWDGVKGYGVYLDCNAKGHNLSIDGHSTWTASWINGAERSAGFMFCDGETVAGGASLVDIYSLLIEGGQGLSESYAGGTNPYDRRGLFRLGVNASSGAIQHRIRCFGLLNYPASGNPAYSVFQVTAAGGTDADNARQVHLMCFGCESMSAGSNDAGTTDQVGFLGGRVPMVERPARGAARQGMMIFCIGKDSVGEHVQNWINTRDFEIRGFSPHMSTVADLIPGPWMRYYFAMATDLTSNVRDSTAVGGGSIVWPVFWNGSVWKVM